MTGRFPRYVYPKWFRDAIQAHGREAAEEAPRARGVTQTRFLRHAMAEWDGDLSLDLQQFFGIDLLDDGLLRRPWWWLRARILGLLDIHDARLNRWATEVSA